MAKDEGAKERGKDLVKEFVAQVLEGSMTVTRDAETMINRASRRSIICSPSSSMKSCTTRRFKSWRGAGAD